MIFDTFQEQLLGDCTEYNVQLVSTSSYDEEKIQKKIEESGQVGKYFACALQLALVGWGNGNYGDATLDDETFSIADFISEQGGYVDNAQGTNLDDDDITPKRVIRVFRWQIKDWIKNNDAESFLIRKYGGRLVRRHKEIIFPMAEHLVSTVEEGQLLRSVYVKVDQMTGSQFVKRIDRVFAIRGLLPDE
jgi:hypothetical protein